MPLRLSENRPTNNAFFHPEALFTLCSAHCSEPWPIPVSLSSTTTALLSTSNNVNQKTQRRASAMASRGIHYSDARDLPLESVLALYRANGWSSAKKPDLLHKALMASHSLVTAWDKTAL